MVWMATALLVVMIRDRFRPGTRQVRGNSMDNQSHEVIKKNSSTSGHMWIVLSWSISLALWWKTFDNLIFKKCFYLNLIVNHLIAQKNSKDCIFFVLLINATFILFTCFLLTHQSNLRPSGRFPFLNLSCKYLFGGDASHCNCERGGQHGVVGSLRSNTRITDTTPCAPLWVED